MSKSLVCIELSNLHIIVVHLTALIHLVMNICRFLGPIFQEAGKGKFDCSELDGEGIFGELECENAAVKLDKKLVKNETSDIYPKGCYVYRIRVGTLAVAL